MIGTEVAPIPGIAGPGAPYPQWGVAVGSPGQHVTKITNALAKTIMESVSYPSKVYFFTSQQAAENWVASNGGETFIPGTQAPLNAANNAINATTGVGTDFYSLAKGLTARQLWVRVAEGVLGLALLLVAVAELGKGTGIGKVAKAVPFI